MTMHDDFKWYVGADEEYYTAGPYDTRDEAVDEAIHQCIGEFKGDDGVWKIGFYLAEATKPSLRLSEWVLDAEEILTRADEELADSDRTGWEGDEGPWFECSSEQTRDLERRIKKACDEWQAEHKLTFNSQTFGEMRGPEYVVAPHPDEEHSQ